MNCAEGAEFKKQLKNSLKFSENSANGLHHFET